jgi:predicted DNA-binding transcriptional regulator YafY
MNRIDRLFAITVVLQSRQQVRAADLAALFEVSERTIYRDMDALNESGIPVVSSPGTGYSLAEGFYLPTVQLTYRVEDLRELKPWLLSWGAGAKLLSPPEARETIREELRRQLDNLNR